MGDCSPTRIAIVFLLVAGCSQRSLTWPVDRGLVVADSTEGDFRKAMEMGGGSGKAGDGYEWIAGTGGEQPPGEMASPGGMEGNDKGGEVEQCGTVVFSSSCPGM